MSKVRETKIALWVAGVFGLLLCALIGVFAAAVAFPGWIAGTVAAECEGCTSAQALNIAAQLGRLDIVSLVLALLAIAVAFFALLGFVAVRADAVFTAREVASTVVKDEVRVYVDRKLPEFLNDELSERRRARVAEPSLSTPTPTPTPDTATRLESFNDQSDADAD